MICCENCGIKVRQGDFHEFIEVDEGYPELFCGDCAKGYYCHIHGDYCGVVCISQLSSYELWQLACEHDNVPLGVSFIVFSDGNPFVDALDAARAEGR